MGSQRQADCARRDLRRCGRAGYDYTGLRIRATDVGARDRPVAGLVCSFMVLKIKKTFGYDDSLDAFGVHGMGGTVGAVLTGVLASGAINAVFGKDAAGQPRPTGAIGGNWHQILNQGVGAGIGWLIAIAGTLILLFAVDKAMGLRLSTADETSGLDLSQHGEEGYELNA